MTPRRDIVSTSSKQKFGFGGELAVGIMVGVVLSLSLFMFMSLKDADLSRQELVQLLPATIALVVAAASSLIAFGALYEQRRIRQAGTDPVMLVHLGSSTQAKQLILLNLSNVGAGAALNVHLTQLTKLGDKDLEKIKNDFSTLSQPIQVVLQGQSVQYHFGVGHELLSTPIPEPIEFEISYDDIDGNSYRSKQIVDVRELEQQIGDHDPIQKISFAMEKLPSILEKFFSQNREFSVVTETRLQHRDRKSREYKAILEKRRKKN